MSNYGLKLHQNLNETESRLAIGRLESELRQHQKKMTEFDAGPDSGNVNKRLELEQKKENITSQLYRLKRASMTGRANGFKSEGRTF